VNSNLKQGIRSSINAVHTSGTTDHLWSILALARAQGDGGTTSNALGVVSRVDAYANAIVSNGYGFYALNGYTLTGGTIGNLYGLFIEDLTAGSSSNWSIYTGSAPSHFGGDVGIGGDANLASGKLYKINNIAIPSTIYKTTTGDPTSGLYESVIVINIFDNNVKIYADGALRQIASW
jgi:hypothetical protein